MCDSCGLCVVGNSTEVSLIYYDDGVTTPFSQVKFTVQLKRKSLYYFINLVLPCCVFSILSVITFILPPACGERIGVGQCLINFRSTYRLWSLRFLISRPTLRSYLYRCVCGEIAGRIRLQTTVIDDCYCYKHVWIYSRRDSYKSTCLRP